MTDTSPKATILNHLRGALMHQSLPRNAIKEDVMGMVEQIHPEYNVKDILFLGPSASLDSFNPDRLIIAYNQNRTITEVYFG